MATVIVMPRLSPTMEEGVLLKWTKKEGDKINPGDVIAEVETDKANMDFPLEDEGTLLKLLVKEGDTVKLGLPVAVLGEPGEDAAAALASSAEGASSTEKAAAEKPAAKKSGAEKSGAEKSGAEKSGAEKSGAEKLESKPGTGAGAEKAESKPDAGAGVQRSDVKAGASGDGGKRAAPTGPSATQPARPSRMESVPAPADRAATGNRVRSSPLARKIARERGVDLALVDGSGPHGRVVMRDLEGLSAASAPRAVAVARTQPLPVEGDQTVPLSPMRRTIARRLVEAKQTVPHFYVSMDADAEALWEFHAALKGASDVKVSLNDLVVKALAIALARIPAANASFTDGGILRHGHVDVGIAVSIEDGLVTPVVRDADRKTIGTIARESADLIDRARARKLKADEFSGGTFSVSNMGMYGVTSFAAIINPPEGGILAVGAVQKRAVVVTDENGDDSLAVGRRMTLTLSCDHRVIDGALGAELLREVVRVIERPHVMAL